MANSTASIVLEPKFANLEMRDGSEWVYRIPDYLAGKVKLGAKVVVKYPTFSDDRFATVVDTLVSTHLRDDQLGVIVAVIDEQPYIDYLERAKQEKLILQAAAQRKERIELLAGYAEAAKSDAEMEAILAALEANGSPKAAESTDAMPNETED